MSTSQFRSLQSPAGYHQSSNGGGGGGVDEEDLLALLSSDSFSLESQRDRDLIKLGSFLNNIIPSQPQPLPQPIPSTSRSIPPHPHSLNSFGSPMSYHSSTSSNNSNPVPPAPSSSLNNPPPPFPIMDFSNFNGFGGWGKELEGFKGKESTSFNQSRWNTVSGSNSRDVSSGENTPMRRRSSVANNRNGQAWRVPNCSRERVEEERESTPVGKGRGNRGTIETREEEERGWKSRLRKSTVEQSSSAGNRNSGRGYDDDHGGGGGRDDQFEEEEDDLMMDD